MKRRLVTVLGLLVTVVLLWWAVKDVEWARVGEVLVHADYLWLLPAMAFTMLGYLVRSYRWKFLLRPVKNIRTGILFSTTMVGFLANVTLPGRLGELVRPWLIGRREGVSKSASLATIVVERVFDLTTLLVCFGVVLLLHPRSFSPALRAGGFSVLATNLAAVAFLVFLEVYTAQVLGVARWLTRPLPARLGQRIVGLLASFAEGLGSLRDVGVLVRVSLLSVLMWLTIVLSVWSTLMALHLGLPLYASAILLVAISVGIMLPSAPGYLGPMQVACGMGLAVFHVNPNTSFAYSCLYMFTQHIPVLVFGFYFMWREDLTLGEISRVGSAEAEPAR